MTKFYNRGHLKKQASSGILKLRTDLTSLGGYLIDDDTDLLERDDLAGLCDGMSVHKSSKRKVDSQSINKAFHYLYVKMYYEVARFVKEASTM